MPIDDEPRAVVALARVGRASSHARPDVALRGAGVRERRPPAAGGLPRHGGRPRTADADRGARALGGRLPGRTLPAARTSRARGEPSPSSTSPSATGCAPSSTRRGRAASTPRRPSSTCSRWSASTPERRSSTRCCTRRSAARPTSSTGWPRVQADFLRGVTHDLQTPLTSIGALATELRANAGLPEARPGRPRLDHPPGRAAAAHGEPAARRLAPRGGRAHAAAGGLRRSAARRADVGGAARRSARSSSTSTAPPHLAVADPDRLEQVLWALLDNAVKYSPAGSPIERRHRAPERRPSWRSPSVTRARAWTTRPVGTRSTSSFASDQARKLAPDGSGVGLYAARGLMEAMGGAIEIDSRLGGGTAVTLRVPAEPSEAERGLVRPYRGGRGSSVAPCKVTCKVTHHRLQGIR